jgi:SAM-dependent methyltransferase
METSVVFYNANQRESVGQRVNRAGHSIMSGVDLLGKRVLELGPGALDHMHSWTAEPEHFTCVDIDKSYLDLAVARLEERGVSHNSILMSRDDGAKIPVEDSSYDIVLTFYSLEHIHPLEPHLHEIRRILKPGGLIVGAIPCEGGFSWGVGRYITSRRWLKKNTTINPDKLICWEHPNFSDRILNALEKAFDPVKTSFWPLRVPLLDINLIARFVLKNPTN